jgi:hypothetical protein
MHAPSAHPRSTARPPTCLFIAPKWRLHSHLHMRPRRTRMVSSSTSHSLSLAHGPGELLPVALSLQRRPPPASPRAHRLLVPAPHRLHAPAMADLPDPTLATADPAAPTPAMANRALAMVDPTDLAPGMAPAMTSYRRASRYSDSSSTAGTEGLRRALGRSPATSTHQVHSPVPSFPLPAALNRAPQP